MDLSLKYRPKSFKEVISQQFIIKSIMNALKHDEIAPLYLFSGARGTGKTTIARLIAMSLCCEQVNDVDPCGVCSHCQSILQGNYFADVHEINAAQYTRKGDADSMILDNMNYEPLMASKKVYILDECHQLSKAAQQSLLKVFEEPPDNVVFVLCTTEINKVLSTIVDRALHFEFKSIPVKMIYEHLKSICVAENIEIDDDALWFIAKESNGSLRRPFKILNTIGTNDKIDVEALESIIGKTNTGAAIDVLKMLISGNRYKSISLADSLSSEGKDISSLFFEIMECFLDILRLKTYKNDNNGIINKPDYIIQGLNEIGAKIQRGEQIQKSILALEHGLKRINESYLSDAVIITLTFIDVINALHA
jgi:DNA polymerase-3 subunit gamma/tau